MKDRRDGDMELVDRARFPRPKPCAEYLSPQASRILADMGALDAIEESGAAALAGIRVRAPNGAVIAGDFAEIGTPRRLGTYRLYPVGKPKGSGFGKMP